MRDEKVVTEFVQEIMNVQGWSAAVQHDVLSCYGERHRRYHTLEHLECMFLHNDQPSRDLTLAILFHDVVYALLPKSPGLNEYQSARFLHSLKIGGTEKAEEAIIATSCYMIDQPFLSPLAQQLCDLDLCNLALPYEVFCYWCDLALEEAKIIYKGVVKDPMGFKFGQSLFLSKMLKRERLYYIHNHWELPARENVEQRKAELEKELAEHDFRIFADADTKD